MRNVKRSEKLIVKFLVFPIPIGLNTLNFGVKESLNMFLELEKDALSIDSINHKINPCEFCKVINKTDIILITTNTNWSGAPNIRMNNFKWHSSTMNRSIIRYLMTFSQLIGITNRGHTRLLETREIFKTQNRPNDLRRWMTKSSMPLIRPCRVANKGLMKGLDIRRLEGIETRLTLSF
jgi:hypothetical protein